MLNDRSDGYRPRLRPEDRALLLEMAQQGVEQKVMCERLGRSSSTVHDWLKRVGGYETWVMARSCIEYKTVKIELNPTYTMMHGIHEVDMVIEKIPYTGRK